MYHHSNIVWLVSSTCSFVYRSVIWGNRSGYRAGTPSIQSWGMAKHHRLCSVAHKYTWLLYTFSKGNHRNPLHYMTTRLTFYDWPQGLFMTVEILPPPLSFSLSRTYSQLRRKWHPSCPCSEWVLTLTRPLATTVPHRTEFMRYCSIIPIPGKPLPHDVIMYYTFRPMYMHNVQWAVW